MPIYCACGAGNPPDAVFCNRCGALVREARELERRKLATLVFCDLSGSTAMAERLDVESVREILDLYFVEMRAALERHGGIVEKFIGDAVVGVFGLPELHEDDALRACRAALEMQARVARLNNDLLRRFDISIAVRIGVNSGEIVGTRDTFATGDAVNVAARLEQAATPGEVLLGETTYSLVRGAVRAERVEPVEARGKSEPVRVRRLLDVSGPGAAPARGPDPLVGRVDELELLEHELAAVLAGSGARVVTVVGEPGVGKSRLAEELVTRIGSRGRVARGTCLSYGDGITYWAIGQIVRRLAEIADDCSRDEALALVERSVAEISDAGQVAARIGQLLGLAEGTSTAPETAWAIRHFLAAHARSRPLVVLIDDLHWAEPMFLDLITDLPAGLGAAPVLLVCLARPELLELRPAWEPVLRLEPLVGPDVDLLLQTVLGDTPPPVRALLAAESAGNPLFAEELAAMLVDAGVLHLEDGVCTVRGDLGTIALPTSLQGLLGARLDALPTEEREALERGSIEGEVFHGAAVVELSDPRVGAAVPATLEALVAKDFIRRREPGLANEAAFRFKHILVRDAAYGAMPKRLRGVLHEQFAGWVERVVGERVGEYEEILGYHLEQSYRLRADLGPLDEETRAVGDRAARHLAAAASRAHARGDRAAAAKLFAAASELASDPLDAAKHALRRGTAAREIGAFDVAEAVVERVREQAVANGWPGVEAGADVELAMLKVHTDTAETATRLREAGTRALAVFEALGDDRGVAVALVLLARERWLVLRGAEMESLLERALPAAERARDAPLVATVLDGLARVAVFGPRPAPDAVARCHSLIERGDEIGPTASAGITMALAVLEASIGNRERARVLTRESQAVMGEMTDLALAAAKGFAGLAALVGGDPHEAEQELGAAFSLLAQFGDRAVASTVAAIRARALVELGRHEDAERMALIGLEWADAGDIASHAYANSALARCLAYRGLLEEACEKARHAVQLSVASDFLNQRGDGYRDLALVLEAAGDREGARAAAGDALALYRRKGNVLSAAGVASLLSGRLRAAD